MSHKITPGAYKTKLGNATAKSILAMLGNVVNADGFGWPSVRYIAKGVEVNPRTVQRIIQVFVDIGLIERRQHLLRLRVVHAA
jgi:pyocin large subunit-like protein